MLRQVVHSLYCMEVAANSEMLKIALEIRPDSVTLVPERREELTTEGGLDVLSSADEVAELVRVLEECGIRSCLFIDPDLDQVKAAHRLGARAVEIHTGRYADGGQLREQEFRAIEDAVRFASKLQLEVGVGHGLDYENVRAVARLDAIQEFSIGHSIVSRAVLVGIERAVREMRERIGI